MIVTLRNEWLTVEIEDVGAQLASITSKDGTQYLWQGDPEIWPRRAPLLFPVIGRLKDGEYTLDGETYTISSHGFCRDALFTVEQHGETSVSFHLSDSGETRAAYPFAFHLTVTYTLDGNRLVKAHRVENRSEREMYFEVGGHDGFLAPLAAGEADDIVMAGISAETILHILDAAGWVRHQGIRLILCAATKTPLLRRELCRRGFALEDETPVVAAGRVYTVLCAGYTGEAREPDGEFCLLGLSAGKPHAARLRDDTAAKLEKQLRGLRGHEHEEALRLLTWLRGLELT